MVRDREGVAVSYLQLPPAIVDAHGRLRLRGDEKALMASDRLILNAVRMRDDALALVHFEVFLTGVPWPRLACRKAELDPYHSLKDREVVDEAPNCLWCAAWRW